MLGCKAAETPMETNYKTRFSQESPLVDTGRYQLLVDKLIYLTHTRPDISFPVSVISQFMNCPNEEHLEAAYQTLRYLKSAPGKGIFFKKNDIRGVQIYTDADWAGCPIDRRSTSGY
ncbi:Retrovirus-related Pol polyprotein from transposon RE1 [Senna tora]|uniref:Retrovirus-related Pol polyprotein from transposon RE1 n=1 Tax=Senna tora TaxID=362788 RepID=A0A834SR46_9FABA|nr:Retrovirus-related Pol polyprotein from transposon RE1 [Senna tora]